MVFAVLCLGFRSGGRCLEGPGVSSMDGQRKGQIGRRRSWSTHGYWPTRSALSVGSGLGKEAICYAIGTDVLQKLLGPDEEEVLLED